MLMRNADFPIIWPTKRRLCISKFVNSSTKEKLTCASFLSKKIIVQVSTDVFTYTNATNAYPSLTLGTQNVNLACHVNMQCTTIHRLLVNNK